MLALLLTLAQLADGQVIETPHAPDTVIERVETWAALNFESAQDAVQKTGSTFVAKGWMPFPCKGFFCVSTYRLNFTLKVDTKDGRFRVQVLDPIKDMRSSRYGSMLASIDSDKERKEVADALASLTESLIQSVQEAASDDW